LRSKCLYLSTCTLSSSSCYLSLSISRSFYSYSCLISLYFSSSADLNYGVSSIVLPPTNTYEVSILILAFNNSFSSFSLTNSLDLASRAVIAACLSISNLLFYSAMSWRTSLLTGVTDYRLSSSILSLFISISYLRSKAYWSRSSFIWAWFLIFFALVANFKVLIVSLNASLLGDIIAIMVVLQLPPRESSKILVSLLLR